MEDVRCYTKTIVASGIVVDAADIKDTMVTHRSHLLSLKKIPSVIDPHKKYADFALTVTAEIVVGKKIILLSAYSSKVHTVEVQIVLVYSYFSYKDILREFLPASVEVPTSFQVVGTILHLNLSDEQLEFKKIIADVLLDKVNGIETVIRKVGEISAEYRNFEIEVLSGKNELTTTHTENNLHFFIDYENVYWNSRQQDERKCVLALLNAGDTLCDPFCGAGPLVVPALAKGCHVYCNDLNPRAIECLEKNVALNRVSSTRLVTACKDAADFLDALQGRRVDHIVLNLPSRSLEFVRHLRGFSRDAYLHCYFFCRDGCDPVDLVRTHTRPDIAGYRVSILRNVSPTKKMYKLEARLSGLFGT